MNSSLESGILPKDLKCSVVVPVPKVDNPKKLEELRPVNLIPIIDKVLELLVHEQLTEYFEKNNIFCQGQFGFRNKHSCESACQFVFSKWKKDIDEGNIVLGVFVDLKRAFETIDRKKLIEMCGVYGVGGVALGWLGSYLDKRYQITKIDDRVSQQMEICYGVPQGSVLGPLLFILYINDITKYVRNSFVNLYADDTVLSVSGTNYLEVVNIMNSELKKLDNWLKFKKLKLNADKTKFMVFGSQHNCKLFKELNFNITIESVNIEQVDIFKYLGIQLDPQLKLSHHVDYMCRKLGKKIGYFNRISSRLSGLSKRMVYNSIIYPQFSYCISLLSYCNKEDIHRIQILQNRAMRVLLGCNRYTPVRVMCCELGFLNVDQLVLEANLMFIYKILNDLTPTFFKEQLVKRGDMMSYNLRTGNEYHVPKFKSNFLMKSLFISGVMSYNCLPTNVKRSANVKEFKYNIRLYLKNHIIL